MKALKHILIWTALLGMRPAMAQDLVADLTPPAERGAASFEVWANQRTNAFTSGFVHTAQQGGFLSREFLQDMLDAHPVLGGMGGQVGWSKRFSTRPLGDGPWALTGAFGSEMLVSALWRRELLELGLIGNANHTGRVDVFNGTGMRAGGRGTSARGSARPWRSTAPCRTKRPSGTQRAAASPWARPGSGSPPESSNSARTRTRAWA